MRGATRPRWADEDGLAGAEALIFGVLIFVVGTLLIVNAWGVIDAKMAASASAREATRVLVESPVDVAVTALATQVVADTLVGHGKDPARVVGAPTITARRGIARCARIRVDVRYRVPTITLPWIGGLGSGHLEVRGSHTELVDPFRSGLSGEATCDL
ncbi:MAG: hypothetical protein WEB09_03105 [Nitriliruptor sp.]